jgi:hypothetical protein
MGLTAQLDSDFAFAGADGDATDAPATVTADAVSADTAHATQDPLGPLALLVANDETPVTWIGHGFNAIWRPHHPAQPQDRFLALNMTDDKIVFTRIKGKIPNRGLAMHDINMRGLTYMQQINVAGQPDQGLHIEPGIWAHVPSTADPKEAPTVVRMASIPHGTSILAQGTAQEIKGGGLELPDSNILPFFFGSDAPGNGQFSTVAQTFPELELSRATAFRTAPLDSRVTPAVVQTPNQVIQDALAASLSSGHSMKARTFLHVSTTDDVIKGGGGTANTVFLATSQTPAGGNAQAVSVEARFWIETIEGPGGRTTLQLQYTQLVMLDFNGIHWPHVTVGTLVRQ